MNKIFLIPGLGADSRIYNNIAVNDYELIFVNWIEPDSNDTLSSYSKKLCNQYDMSGGSILLGNSMGGMIAIEIAKIIAVKKIIQVSSIRTRLEEPWNFKIFRVIPIYKIIPKNLIPKLGSFVRLVFRDLKKEDAWLFKDMLEKSSPKFMKWACGAILKWNNHIIPPNVFQIIGDKDEIFPYKRQKEAEVIKGGTHIMIFDRTAEINKFIEFVLSI